MGHDEKYFHALYMMNKCTLYVYIVQGKDGAEGGVPQNNTPTGGHNQARRGGFRGPSRRVFGRGRAPNIYYICNYLRKFVQDFPNPYTTLTYCRHL